MLTGNILTTDGWIYGTLEYENGRITALTGERVDPSTNDAPYILPGFIDLHVHGGGGADVMEGGDAIETITRTHARFGTTSLLATTMTAPRERADECRRESGQHAPAFAHRAARACSVSISKARTSTRASLARNRTLPCPR